MQNAKGTLLVAVLILAVTVTVCPAKIPDTKTEPHHPTAFELLDKYAETQDKLQSSFIIKYEDTSEADIDSSLARGKVKTSTSGELRYDGDRVAIRGKTWGYISPDDFVSRYNAAYKSSLWDGESYFSYSGWAQSPGRLIMYKERHDSWNKSKITKGYGGHELMGFFFGDDERIDLVLRKADTVSVRREMDNVGGSACYVVYGVTNGGKYTVWIAPQRGYNIAKAIVEKEGGGRFYGKQLPRGASMVNSLENVRFEKIDGLWVPMETDIGRKQNIPKIKSLPKGLFLDQKQHHKRTEVILNPDHDALGSFVPDDIPNGSRVRLGNITTIQYTWQDGKLIPNIDEAVIDEIDKMTAEIMAQGNVPTALEADKKESVPESLTALKLLDKFTETQEKLRSFRIVRETIGEGSSNHPASSGKREYRVFHSDFRYDGNRSSTRLERWLKLDSLPDKPLSDKHESYNYTRYLWDGKSAFSYSRDPRNNLGTLIINKGPEAKNDFTIARSGLSTMMGWLSGDSERIDKVLRQADGVSVRDKMENVGDSECYVIEADIKDGKYTVWIDPAHGYNIARAEVRKTQGHLVFGKSLGAGFSISSSFEVARFEQIDDIWLPMETYSEGGSKWPGGHYSKGKGNCKITLAALNADHEALDSFVLDDVPNGATALIMGVPASYTWQDGELIPDIDKAVIDEIDKMTAEIMAEGKVPPAPVIKDSIPDSLTVSELLDKYGETQDKLYQSFIIKYEASIESSSSKPGQAGIVLHMKHAEEFRFDGKTERFRTRRSLWGNVGGPSYNYSKDNPIYQSYMWDGKDLFQYSRNPFNPVSNLGKVHLTRNKDKDAVIKRLYSKSGSLRGSIFGSIERIDSELRKAHTISVRDRTEKVGDSECYVIDAMTKLGNLTVWIDPKHGYNIARFNHEINGERGDLVYGRPLHREDTVHISQRITRFEENDGLWVPMEADVRYYRDMGKDYSKSRTHLKRTVVKLNVDHNALGSFVPDDIKNGARVFLIGVEGIMYTWQDGELIPNIDELVIDEIDKMTAEIMAEGKVPASLKGDKKELVPEPLTALELLDRYAATQNKLQSFIAKAESKIEYVRMGSSSRMEKQNCEFRLDGNRVYHRSFLLPGRTNYNSFLWDGKSFIQYRKFSQLTDGRVFIEKNDTSKKRLIATEYKGAALMGICVGDYDRVDYILRKADKITLKPKTEQIVGSACYVIEATTKRGKYKVWFDPQHGYNIAKIELQKQKGDLIRVGERVKTGMSFLLKNVRFKKIDDIWVPMEADMEQTEDNGSKTTKWHHKRTQMTLNPDHDALDSFVPDDIPNGTKVNIADSPGKYVWQNGQVVDKNGRVIMAQGNVPPALPATSSEPIRNVSPTLGLAKMMEFFEQDIDLFEDAQREANIAAKRLRWLDIKKRGGTMWGSDKWMKEPSYYKELGTPELAEECFSRAIFGFELTIYDDPMLGYSRLEIFHNGFAELFKREDMWKGILHAYDFLSLKLNQKSDLKTIVRVSNHFNAFERMYRIPSFKEQVKGREAIFLEANLQVLKRYRQYLEDYDPIALGTKGSPGFFREPCSVAQVALMLAKQVAPHRYAGIEPALRSIRWTKEQKVEDLKSYINLVIEGLDGIVSNELERVE